MEPYRQLKENFIVKPVNLRILRIRGKLKRKITLCYVLIAFSGEQNYTQSLCIGTFTGNYAVRVHKNEPGFRELNLN